MTIFSMLFSSSKEISSITTGKIWLSGPANTTFTTLPVSVLGGEGEGGRERGREGGKEGGRQGERKKEGSHKSEIS